MATTRKSAAAVEQNGTLAITPANRGKSPGMFATADIADPDEPQEFQEADLGDGITAQICEVTPELASQWLLMLGDKQRGIKDAHYKSIMRDMKEQKFQFNGQPVIFDWGGKVIDGQHRLRAIAETQTTQKLLVIRGLNPECFAYMDITAKRQGADAIDGTNKNGVAAAAVLLYKYHHGIILDNVRLSPPQVLEIVNKHPRLHDSSLATYSATKICGSRGLPIFCHYVFATIDREAADLFFGRLASDVAQYEGSPILMLRRRLEEKHNPTAKLFLIFKAWNAFRGLKKGNKLKIKAGEILPELI